MFRPPFSPGGGLEDVPGDVLGDGLGIGVAIEFAEWRRLAGGCEVPSDSDLVEWRRLAGSFADPSDLAPSVAGGGGTE